MSGNKIQVETNVSEVILAIETLEQGIAYVQI